MWTGHHVSQLPIIRMISRICETDAFSILQNFGGKTMRKSHRTHHVYRKRRLIHSVVAVLSPAWVIGGLGGGMGTIAMVSKTVAEAAVSAQTPSPERLSFPPHTVKARLGARSQHSMLLKQIVINGKHTSSPYGFVVGGTTYLPLYYVMQALTQVGVKSQWQVQSWDLTVPGITVHPLRVGSGNVSVYVNGVLVYRVNKVVDIDPSSSQSTTFIPVYAIMQVLKSASLPNTWDGTRWGIQGTVSSSQVGPPTTAASADSSGVTGSGASLQGSVSGANPGTPTTAPSLPNAATADSSDWTRARGDIYINATTYNPAGSQTSGSLILKSMPGQAVYLSAASSTRNVASPTWHVNSPDASITSVEEGVSWQIGSSNFTATSSMARFVATKPGIYTVQAATADGDYSVPLVLIVGLSDLKGALIQEPQAQSGVLPLPANVPTMASVTDGSGAGSYVPYTPVNGWLPISGKFTNAGGNSNSVVIDISANNFAQEVNYTIPVSGDGSFSALLRVPFGGQLDVSVVRNFLQQLTKQQYWQPTLYYTVNAPTSPSMSEQAQGLLASATMDYNMSSEFNQEASVIMDNAPSVDTGIAAISNFVSEKILYNLPEYNSGNVTWQDSLVAWQSNSGVCQDIAELTASMLKSIGIPAETVQGSAPNNDNSNDHEWLQAWDGSHWILLDPTWNMPVDSQNFTVNDHLSNEYMTNTAQFKLDHFPQAGKTGTWQ